jgi:hypothetical protein
MNYRFVFAGLLAACLLVSCVSYSNIPAHARVVELTVPGCE